MASNYKRTVIGDVLKHKKYKDADYNPLLHPDYVKFNVDMTIKKGQHVNLESTKFQLNGIEKAVATGKMSPENAEKVKERINKTPDFVRFQIVLVEKNQQ